MKDQLHASATTKVPTNAYTATVPPLPTSQEGSMSWLTTPLAYNISLTLPSSVTSNSTIRSLDPGNCYTCRQA